MEKDVSLLIVGALIALLSSFLTSVFNYRLARRQWLAQEQRKTKQETEKNLAGTWQAVREHQRNVSGPLRGSGVETNGEILPAAISRLNVDSEKVLTAMKNKSGPIELGQLLNIALDSLDEATT
jgi:hypothetical protein